MKSNNGFLRGRVTNSQNYKIENKVILSSSLNFMLYNIYIYIDGKLHKTIFKHYYICIYIYIYKFTLYVSQYFFSLICSEYIKVV